MKKLFTAVLAVALAAVMMFSAAFAADTVLLEGTNGTVDLSTAAEGSKLVVVVECTDDTAGVDAGWGLGGLCIDGGWTVDGGFEAKAEAAPALGDKLTFTWDVDAVKAAATGDVNVNFYNGFTVVTATLSSPDAPAGDPSTPKTADTMTVLCFAGVAALAMVAVVASKKARA